MHSTMPGHPFLSDFLSPKAVFQKPLLCSAFHSHFLFSPNSQITSLWFPLYIFVSHHTSGMNSKRSVSQWCDTTCKVIPPLQQCQPGYVFRLSWKAWDIVSPYVRCSRSLIKSTITSFHIITTLKRAMLLLTLLQGKKKKKTQTASPLLPCLLFPCGVLNFYLL